MSPEQKLNGCTLSRQTATPDVDPMLDRICTRPMSERGNSFHEEHAPRPQEEWPRQTGRGDETLPGHPAVPGVVLLQRVVACRLREHQHSEVGRDVRPDLKARDEDRGAFRTPRSLPVSSTRRRTGIEPAWELSPPHRF
jgi:hypothetical protein